MHDNIIPYVAELAAVDIKEEVRQLRLDAFRELQTQINTFANRMYDPRLIADIAETRAKFRYSNEFKPDELLISRYTPKFVASIFSK